MEKKDKLFDIVPSNTMKIIDNLPDETKVMDKKNILGELKVQLDNGKEDVISNIISKNGYNTLINFIEQEKQKSYDHGYDDATDML